MTDTNSTTPTTASTQPTPPVDPAGPRTLAIDVGGSGLKAVLLARTGQPLSARTRRVTPYPCPPQVLLPELEQLAATQPAADRVSVGFPGTIRKGRVRDLVAFRRPAPGLPPDPGLTRLWTGFDLQGELQRRFGRPVRVANDADMQGCAVVTGEGMELVVTLGTGVGCAVFFDGALLPHMELSHGRFGQGQSIEVACGDHERRRVGGRVWLARVLDALAAIEEMVLPDHVYLGGGNAKRLDPDAIGPNRTVVSNVHGLLGGIALWERAV